VSRKTLLASLLVVGGFAAVYANVVVKLVHDWATDGNYSHGFLIVPLAAYFAWERRHRLQSAAAGRPGVLGFAVVVASLVVLAAGVLGSELFLTRISMLGAIAGTTLFLFGSARLRVLAFPLAFLILMVPWPAIVFNQIAFPLQLLASRVGELALGSLGVPVLREGNVLILASTTLEVADACSGIRSLISLVTLGIVFGYFADARRWARTAIALSTVPVAIVANGIRVAGTGIAASRFGPAAAEGVIHVCSGWLMFVASFLMLFGLQRLLAVIPRPSPRVDVHVAA